MKNVIEVKNITKSFKIFYDKSNLLKEKILFKKRNLHEIKTVLNNISFKVKKGEAVGIIGRNGCGKSTLLKLLTRIIYPNSGTINIDGKVSSLIELGAGFHPDMSGRENIYTNAAIFGLNKKQIDLILDDIIEFSELEEFIDNPVRTYSSGMYMRLAFSVAIHVNADILLIDEILAVGDIRFQKKCFKKLRELKENGVTIIIVSHSLEQIDEFCDRCIWLENGKIKKSGEALEVTDFYRSYMAVGNDKVKDRENNKNQEQIKEILPDFCSKFSIREGSYEIEFTNVRLLDINNNEKKVFEAGEPIIVCMDYKGTISDVKCNFGIGIRRDDGVNVYGTNIQIEYGKMIDINETGTVKAVITGNCLLTSRYMLDVAIHSGDKIQYDYIRNVTSFDVINKKRDIGICRLENYWEVDGKKL